MIEVHPDFKRAWSKERIGLILRRLYDETLKEDCSEFERLIADLK
jgi:hypothetical protein